MPFSGTIIYEKVSFCFRYCKNWAMAVTRLLILVALSNSASWQPLLLLGKWDLNQIHCCLLTLWQSAPANYLGLVNWSESFDVSAVGKFR